MKTLDRVLQRIRLGKARPFVRPGDTVLDIGCADGLLSRLCPQLGRYVGIDPDAPVEQSRKGVTFINGLFPHEGLDPAAEFDVITALAVLEHIPREAQTAFATACARHLKSSGVLLVSVPAPAVDWAISVLKRLKLLDGMRDDEHYGYNHAITPGLFHAVGLTLEEHERFEMGLNHFFVFRRPVPTATSLF